ncbi:hypothetical protein HPB47_007142, partial [Ixodes persulcatus]
MLGTTDKMAGVIKNPSNVGQRAAMKFLTAEGCRPLDIHRRMQAMYAHESGRTRGNDRSSATMVTCPDAEGQFPPPPQA